MMLSAWGSVWKRIDSELGFGADLAIFVEGGIPGLGVARLITFELETLADDGAGIGEGFDFTDGHGLDEDISDGGSFDGAGDDGAIAGVGGHLIEQFVLGTAADDVDGVEAMADDVFEICEGVAVG
jgi:hypothetical protein